MLAIDWAGHEWNLLPEKALHWPARKTVIIADVHFGKAAAFRHHGVPVPSGTTSHDLDRLSSIIARTRCDHLLILGDLLHARHGRERETLRVVTEWRARHASLDVTLVRGNHDQQAGDPPGEWRVTCVDEPFAFEGMAMRHAASDGPDGSRREPSIAGHVHPCLRLRDVDGTSLRVPCFHFAPRRAVLPAFGSFTGGHVIRPRQGDRVFALDGNDVLEVQGVCA